MTDDEILHLPIVRDEVNRAVVFGTRFGYDRAKDVYKMLYDAVETQNKEYVQRIAELEKIIDGLEEIRQTYQMMIRAAE